LAAVASLEMINSHDVTYFLLYGIGKENKFAQTP
jgi:hypothetical protein